MALPRCFDIHLNAFEVGVLVNLLWESPQRQSLMAVINQLRDISDQIRREAGVQVEELSDGQLKFTDADGNVIIRFPYGWEKP